MDAVQRPATLLKVLLRRDHKQRYETFCIEYEKAAAQVGAERSAPSKAQYHRWLSGHLKGGAPYPEACRVLEAMFPPWSATDLCGPYDPARQRVGARQHPAAAGLLDSVQGSFSAFELEGAWITSFTFTHHHDPTPRHHVDIVRITAVSNQEVFATNHPPEPRTEDRAIPFRNEIEARLVNRHLIGQWKHLSDTRYFGTLHLAVLPGEAVMAGYYTGFANDIETSIGPWKWVRLDAREGDLAALVLRPPQDLSAVIEAHSEYDAPLPLTAVSENQQCPREV